MIPMAAGPKRILRVHLEGKFLELVQQEKPTLVHDMWQTPPNEGVRLWVGRTRADNRDPG